MIINFCYIGCFIFLINKKEFIQAYVSVWKEFLMFEISHTV